MHDWAAGAAKHDPASSLKTVSHQTALRNIMFHSREWSTCLLKWEKIYGYSYIWHNTEYCQIGWSILLFIFTGGNRTKLPSSRWRRRGRSLREVFARSLLFATTDLSQIYNREARRHGTPCTKTTDSYLFSFLYNNPRKIRRETTVGKFVPNNGRR